MITLSKVFLDRPIAHRGYHDKTQGRVENSPSAFAAAVDAGYPIELDLQLSRDGVPMVFHDPVLDRLTDHSGDVGAYDAADLTKTRLKGSTDLIPTLSDVLAQVAGAVPLLIELKDQHGEMGETDGTLEAATVNALDGYTGAVALMSFNPHMVRRLSALTQSLPLGLISSAWRKIDEPHVPVETRARLAGIPDFEDVGACFLSHDHTNLDNPRVEQLKFQGVPILCWTIRSEAQADQARKVAENITFEGFAA